jgi:hypothetical protein
MGGGRKESYLVVKLGGLGIDCHVIKRTGERVWKLGKDQWMLRSS